MKEEAASINRLVDALKGVFTAAISCADELTKTASFTVENVDWTGQLNRPVAASNSIVDMHLQAACDTSGQYQSSSHKAAQALLAAADQLTWRTPATGREHEPDIALFSRNFTSTSIIGDGGLLASDKVIAGFSLQGPDTYYPPHAHDAEESYWIIGGEGDWKVGTKPWFAIKPGDSIYHESLARHVMQTHEQPLLAVWLRTSHLLSEVVIVRG